PDKWPGVKLPRYAFEELRISRREETPKGTQRDFWPASQSGGQISHPLCWNHCILSERAVIQTRTAMADR
ncbi:MAG: hypothetical protein H6Q05_4783, partial [Acidobacteria bacterium]|nr:hypothetical protein [Acidobacteriota bacterium]